MASASEYARALAVAKPHFRRYNSFKNVNHAVTAKLLRKVGDDEAVATEKYHGANFSFLVVRRRQKDEGEHEDEGEHKDDGFSVVVGKRSGVVTEEELHTFYECGTVLDRYRDAAVTFARKVGNVHAVQLYGELYGGLYRDEAGELATESGSKYLQNSILYSPRTRFVAFDARVATGGGKSTFLDFADLTDLAAAAAIPCVRALHRGTLSELLKLNPEVDSSVPAELGHAPLPHANIMEGFVLRPVRETLAGQARAMIKLKSGLRNNVRRIQVKASKRRGDLDAEAQAIVDGVAACMTREVIEARVAELGGGAVNAHKLASAVARDAYADWLDTNEGALTKQAKGALHDCALTAVQAYVAELEADTVRTSGKEEEE